jgi:hypothetical protein
LAIASRQRGRKQVQLGDERSGERDLGATAELLRQQGHALLPELRGAVRWSEVRKPGPSRELYSGTNFNLKCRFLGAKAQVYFMV